MSIVDAIVALGAATAVRGGAVTRVTVDPVAWRALHEALAKVAVHDGSEYTAKVLHKAFGTGPYRTPPNVGPITIYTACGSVDVVCEP